MKHAFPITLLLGLSLALTAYLFGPLFWHPNAHSLTVMGDGFIIQYQMSFYVRHGSGWWLTSMNYPHGELLFMTDAQAALAMLLGWIHRHLFTLAEQVVGISNGLLLYLLPLGSLFTWLSLRRLGVGPWFALPFAIWVTFLSPQLSRLGAGHYGLGYVFFIPLLIWWALKVYGERRRWRPSTWLVVWPVAMFIGFNNPYLLVIGASFLLAFGLVSWALQRRWSGWRAAMPFFITALGPVLVVWAFLTWLDPYVDRVKVPFGFFVNASGWRGLLLPSSGAVFDLLHHWFDHRATAFEGRAYLGFTAVIILFAGALGWIWRLAARPRMATPDAWSQKRAVAALLLAGSLVFIYAALVPRVPGLAAFADRLAVLTQFRAPGRFAWVTYYTFTLVAVVVLWRAYDSLRSRQPGYAMLLALVPIVSWGVDAVLFARAQQGAIFSNPFRDLASSYEAASRAIAPEDYQAMLLLPLDLGWSKVHFPYHYNTHHHGLRLSSLTGLPMINARLSRIPVGELLDLMELGSDPVVEKTRFEQLPDERPILILTGAGAALSEPESLLIRLSDTLYRDDRFSLFRFDPKHPYFATYRQAIYRQYGDPAIASPDTALAYVHFDKQRGLWPHRFAGAGALSPEQGEGLVWQGPMPERGRGKESRVSLWVYGDAVQDGGMYFLIRQRNAAGGIVYEGGFSGVDARMAQDGWIRSEGRIPIDSSCHTMEVISYHAYPYLLDELLVQTAGDTVVYRPSPAGERLLINNFRVGPPEK